ncbi:A24 family peptidase [Streptacidiphilus sp. ASG 303]|uniref:prepilin peptidase n=1 Tax=Streptacidiphilus sp. ASG 303 TaxID=2896847 RepID=UPI001E579032|nr:A24 family peptidase [Streptacidiphilus sp. ASG 303]MCD0485773.1 A24 family peptidase [Streptacidiphilus sp. ASG 303]
MPHPDTAGALAGAALGLAAGPWLRATAARHTGAPRLPAVQAAAAAALALLGAAVGLAPVAAPLCWAALLGVPLAFVDAAEHRLPDALTLPAFAGTAVLLVAAALGSGRPGVLPRCLLAALALGALYGATALVAPMGLGDAKLAPTLGALLGWYGWGAVLAGVFAGFLLAGLHGAVLLATRRARGADPLPFGPFMLAGALAAVLLAA